MKLIDAYAKEFINYADNNHFLLMDPDDRRNVCRWLQITPGKLEEVIEYCFKRKFVAFSPLKKYPYCIGPTNRGLTALGLEPWKKKVAP